MMCASIGGSVPRSTGRPSIFSTGINAQSVANGAQLCNAADSMPGSDGMQLVVRRTSTTRMDGKSTSPWRAVEVGGSGTSTLVAHVSVKSRAGQRIADTGTLTLTVTDRSASAAARAQRVTQRVTVTASIIN
jgi:hypothetical protein